MIANIKSVASRFVREEEGATLVEYILLVALIAVICIVAMKFLGNTASNKFTNVATAVG